MHKFYTRWYGTIFHFYIVAHISQLDIELRKNKKMSDGVSYSDCSSSSGGSSGDSRARGSNSGDGSIRDGSIRDGSIGMLMPVGFQLGDLKQRVTLLLRLLLY